MSKLSTFVLFGTFSILCSMGASAGENDAQAKKVPQETSKVEAPKSQPSRRIVRRIEAPSEPKMIVQAKHLAKLNETKEAYGIVVMPVNTNAKTPNLFRKIP